MEWTQCINKAIAYIEANLTQQLSIDEIARQVAISPFYFQKGFAMLCGFTVGEYIKNRRLALAGSALVSGQAKVIDLALLYGYESPDSFTKAFTRFHGATPTAVRRKDATVKAFAPLKLSVMLKGGFLMEYKIEAKGAFTVVGLSKMLDYQDAQQTVPAFWQEAFRADTPCVCGMYGINIDEKMAGGTFEYMIADNYDPAQAIPAGCATKTIPAFTWAVFPCKGAMPDALQGVNQKIFSEWLPGNTEYEIAAGYNIELYGDPAEYPNGTQDDEYYCEVWIPVRRK